jgi:hypothetical protein
MWDQPDDPSVLSFASAAAEFRSPFGGTDSCKKLDEFHRDQKKKKLAPHWVAPVAARLFSDLERLALEHCNRHWRSAILSVHVVTTELKLQSEEAVSVISKLVLESDDWRSETPDKEGQKKLWEFVQTLKCFVPKVLSPSFLPTVSVLAAREHSGTFVPWS